MQHAQNTYFSDFLSAAFFRVGKRIPEILGAFYRKYVRTEDWAKKIEEVHRKQGFGPSPAPPDTDPDWIGIQCGQWIRLRIRIRNPDPDQDRGGQK